MVKPRQAITPIRGFLGVCRIMRQGRFRLAGEFCGQRGNSPPLNGILGFMRYILEGDKLVVRAVVRLVPGVVVFLALAAVLAAACSPPEGEGGGTASALASLNGQAIFAANCAVCHGVDGQGQPDWHIPQANGVLPAPPLNGDGHTWHHSDGLLYRIVTNGGAILEDPRVPGFKSGMPAFGEQLSNQEIVAALEYIKTLWKDKAKRGVSIREAQAEASERDPFPPAPD